MSDANSGKLLDFGEISPVQQKEREARQSAWNKFLYCLYRHLTDPTGGHRGKLLEFAKEVEERQACEDRFKGLAGHVSRMTPLLIGEDESAWLRLLLWIGRDEPMFGQFKDISPFVDKQICCIDDGVAFTPRYLERNLPVPDRLWPVGRDSKQNEDDQANTVFIFPKHCQVQAFSFFS